MSLAREGRDFFLAPPIGGVQLLLSCIANHGGTRLLLPRVADQGGNRKCVTRVSYQRFSPPFTNRLCGPIVAFHCLCGWPAPLTAATPTAPPRCATSSSCRWLGRGATSSSRHRSEGRGCFFHASPTTEVRDCFIHASPTREVHGCFFLASPEGHNFFLVPPTKEGVTSSSSRRWPWRARLLPHAIDHGGVRLLLPCVAGQGGAQVLPHTTGQRGHDCFLAPSARDGCDFFFLVSPVREGRI
jgi:hypothetical protein